MEVSTFPSTPDQGENIYENVLFGCSETDITPQSNLR